MIATSNNSYQYEIYPVDTCGEILSAPPYNSPIYFNDTSFAQTILLKSEINIDYSEQFADFYNLTILKEIRK